MGGNESIMTGDLSRYDLSPSTYRLLQKDHIRFEEKYVRKFGNSFICRILINYMRYAEKNFPDSFEKEIADYFVSKAGNEYHIDFRLSFNKALTEKMEQFDFVRLDSFRKRKAINFILEKYAGLPLAERERIYFVDHFKAIREAIENNIMIVIRNSYGAEYEVRPYKLEIDDNTLSYYLIGFSRTRGSDAEFTCHSNKVSRIRMCYIKNTESALSFSERTNAGKMLEKYGAAYMPKSLDSKEMDLSVIRLTENGYNKLFLRSIAHQRPIPTDEPQAVEINGKTFYELRFDCSYDQIKNYFFPFGADAVVVEPAELKAIFAEKYRDALKCYE